MYEVGTLNSLTDVINLFFRQQLYLEPYIFRNTPLGDSWITSSEFFTLQSKAWMKVLFCKLVASHSPPYDLINSAIWKLAAFSFILPFEINKTHICTHSMSNVDNLSLKWSVLLRKSTQTKKIELAHFPGEGYMIIYVESFLKNLTNTFFVNSSQLSNSLRLRQYFLRINWPTH